MGNERKNAKKIENLARASVALLDTNNDGRLDLQEMATMFPRLSPTGIAGYLDGIRVAELKGRIDAAELIKKSGNVPQIDTTVMTEDMTLIDQPQLSAVLAQSFHIAPERMEKIVKHAFPKGVESVTLSEACAHTPELNCVGLPNGKVTLFLSPGSKS